ncbi:hypothetical protein EZV62_017975 [Acer yangbiense]|uniref:RING-type E3 ubiquitin transferase n=1 Tax=Acer yangbiense TaxID=1000413 RepID=A0A5C7HK20_9ROSI|nr:hypothetical protein EZV62_017975 [Acer yangbiense]
MGCVCCCLNVRDPEDNSISSNDSRSCCFCLNSLIQTVFAKYETLFREYQISTLPCNNPDPGQVDVSSTSNNITNSPRTLQLDSNSELQRDVIVEKSTGAALSMTEQQELSNSGYISLEHVKGELIQKCLLDSSLKSSEDEDVCPTCLEEYTSENPMTVMECSHHYHLSCIFEWMERSATCPVCGKVMMFVETS